MADRRDPFFGYRGLLVDWLSIIFIKRGALYRHRFKYPPSAYYLAYAGGASGLLWRVSGELMKGAQRLKIERAVDFIAKNSLWIYFWHILWSLLGLPLPVRYVFVLCGATGVVWVQQYSCKLLSYRALPIRKQRVLSQLLTG